MKTARCLSWMLVLLLTSCMPRGETKSLQQVLSTARQRYHALVAKDLPGQVQTALHDLSESLASLEEVGDSREFIEYSQSALDALSALDEKASLTARASFAEIESQFREIAANGSELNRPALKLLLARTYNLLASELESTRFNR